MRVVWVLASVGLMFAWPWWAAGEEVTVAVPAVWKEQRLEFSYMGRTARYSCEGLREKVRSLLLDLGARRDLKIAVPACNESDNPALRGYLGPRLSIVFSSPVLPDAAVQPLHAGDLSPVDAHYEPFTLTSDAFRNYGVGDCELVEDFVRQILPKLATREVKQDITCAPYQGNGSRFFVHGEILRAARIP